MQVFQNHRLGQTDEMVSVDTSEAHRLASYLMATQAKRSLDIISRKLDPPVYDTEEFVEAVKRLVLDNNRVQIRVLVFEPQTIVHHGHRLVDMALNLTSFIEFRKPDNEFKTFNESLFIADATGYIHRNSAERYEGTLNFNDRRLSKILTERFEEIWGRSLPDPNLKRVHL